MIAVRCGGFDDADLAGARRSTMILLICWLTTPIRRSAKPHKNRSESRGAIMFPAKLASYYCSPVRQE